MNIHKNARLTPKGREILVCRIVNEGLRVRSAARIAPRRRNVQRFWPCAAPGAPIERLAEEPRWRTARWAGSSSRGD